MASDDREAVPLLPTNSRKQGNTVTKIHVDKDYLPDDDDDNAIIFAQRKKRSTSLVGQDAVLYILYYIQIFALINSLGLRWALPTSWLQVVKYAFLFNVDVWEFCKVNGNSTYKPLQGYFTPSNTLPFAYWQLLVGWAAVLFILFITFVVVYLVLSCRRSPRLLIQIGRLRQVYIFIAQALSLPLGVALARLFHCNDAGFVDIDNSLVCFRGSHWAYTVTALCVALVFYILFPAYLITKTKSEILNMTPERHEGYLQLKEAEYKYGLDILWVVANFHIFSSFKKTATHFRAALHILNFVLCIVYASLVHHMFAQTLTLTCLIFIEFLTFIIMRPFRVKPFNVFLILSFLCLLSLCLMGSFITSFSTTSTASVWTTPTYVNGVLAFVNIFWVIMTTIFCAYLIVRNIRYCNTRFFKEPLWPSILSQNVDKLTPHTKKYIKAVLRARTIIEKTLIQPAIFAPAHELARQIHIINAYCREAEFLRDPIHDTLWDVLDELIEAHEVIAPKSLFAESVKDSIRLTACEFMKMMPQFVRRLAQREYDFILMRPVKRRLLLKMYCMGLFLNGRRERVERQKLTLPGIKKIWQHPRQNEYETEDDGYYEDMYPEAEEDPIFRPTTEVAIDVNIFSPDEIDDDLDIEEAEQWAEQHPIQTDDSPLAHLNVAFTEDDVSAILRDDVSMNLADMMEGVPSRPPTAASTRSTQPDGSNLAVPEHPRPLSPGSPRPASGGPGRVPASDTGRPLSAESGPGSLRPGSGESLRPGSSGSLRPGSGASLRPGSGGARPGSAGSDRLTSPKRPGSGASMASNSGNSGQTTPLPGQIIEEDSEPPLVPTTSL